MLVIENGPVDTGPATSIPYLATLLNTADMYTITSAPVAAFANQTYLVTGKTISSNTPVIVLFCVMNFVK